MEDAKAEDATALSLGPSDADSAPDHPVAFDLPRHAPGAVDSAEDDYEPPLIQPWRMKTRVSVSCLHGVATGWRLPSALWARARAHFHFCFCFLAD